MDPLLCLTKADLADPEPLLASYRPLGVPYVVTQRGADLAEIRRAARRTGRACCSATAASASPRWSTRWCPTRSREVGVVNAVTGRGRHTSTSALMLAPARRRLDRRHPRHPLLRARPRRPRPADRGLPRPARAHRGLPARLHPRRGRAGVRARRGDRGRRPSGCVVPAAAGEPRGRRAGVLTPQRPRPRVAPASPVSTTSTSTATRQRSAAAPSAASPSATAPAGRSVPPASRVTRRQQPRTATTTTTAKIHMAIWQPLAPLLVGAGPAGELQVPRSSSKVFAGQHRRRATRTAAAERRRSERRPAQPASATSGPTKQDRGQRRERDEHHDGVDDERVERHPVDLHGATVN